MKSITLLHMFAALSLLATSCGATQRGTATDDTLIDAPSTDAVVSDSPPSEPASSPSTASRYPWGDDGRIVFTYMAEDNNDEIYVMNSDGSGRVNLTNHEAFDAGPSWSPDGQRIAYYTNRDGNYEIYIMDSDGGNPVNLTNHEAMDLGPSWSPDGEHIAFSSNRDGDSDIYVMDTEGGNLINLTQNSYQDSNPTWSPDGQQLVFASNRSGDFDIYVLDLSGGNPIDISNLEGDEFNPTWSPDGQRIAFRSEQPYGVSRLKELYLVDPDGENLVRLTNHLASCNEPTWSPDGQWIAYAYAESGEREVRVLNVESQEDYPLGEEWAGGYAPDWLWSRAPSEVTVDISTPAPGAAQDESLASMIRVRAGTYSIGGNPVEALEICQIFRNDCQLEWFLDEAPVHHVTLEEFFIDAYEISNADYARCVEAGVCAPPDRSSSATRASYYGNSEYDDYPVIYVSWEDASIYCEWRGARLPTEAEWEVAARGGLEDNPYPWGIELPICESGTLWGAKFDDEALCDDADTNPVGSFLPNFLDIYDMAGNVMEWTADWYDAYPGADPGLSNDFGEMYRVARGGSWYTFGDTLRVSIRFPVSPTASYNHYGFRCADSP